MQGVVIQVQGQQTRKRLEAALVSWGNSQAKSTLKPKGKTTGSLWGNLQTINSRAVTETSKIIEQHLGIPLQLRHIKPGGYASTQEMVALLLPKILEDAKAAGVYSETAP